MKKTLLIICALILAHGLSAQKKIKVDESSKSFSDGNHNALVVNIYEADEDLIAKEWKRLMKDYGAKVSSKKEIFADDATIKDVSDNTVDVYAYTEKNNDGDYELIVGFNLGGAYLSSSQHSSQYKKAESILYDFAVTVTKEAIKEQMGDEERNLSKMTKELEDMVKSKERLEKDIVDYKKKIEQAENDIKTNVSNQETKSSEIEKQKEVISKLKDKKDAVR